MTSRTLRFGAAVLTSVALVACNKPADKPVTDSTAAANAVPTPPVVPTVDSAAKHDSTAAKPKADAAMPAPAPAKK